MPIAPDAWSEISRRPQSLDTSLAAEARQIAVWRGMSPAEKLHVVAELCRASAELARAGVKIRHPEATPGEIELRLIALRLDRAAMVRWFAWDPEREGY